MENLILVGLAAAVLLTAAGNLFPNRPQPPQIIYVRAQLAEPRGTGCLPLVILIAVILLAITLA